MNKPKTSVIYEPRGRAREYSPLAVNLYTGCPHGCKYCFAPGALHRTRDAFHANVAPRKDIRKKLEKDAKALAGAGCEDEILLCFTCDPYPCGRETQMTRIALEILGHHGLNATVLTKSGMQAARDFDLLREYGFSFGTTLSFMSNRLRVEWEPKAAPVHSRQDAIVKAHTMGIRTWVSVEPVVAPGQALLTIECLAPNVDFWKVGKLNHSKEIEATIDWAKFLADVTALLDSLGADYMIKKDLAAYGEVPEVT